MAIFNFTVPIYGFDQWSGASTNNTVGYSVGTTFSLNAGATLSVVDVQDDDGNPVGSALNEFDDGYIDPTGDGSPPSTANNDQVLTQAITVNGQSFSVGDQIELEFAFTTTTGETFWVIRIDGVNVGISGSVLPTPGTTYTVASSSDGQDTPVDDVPCYTDGAMVETPDGPVAIEDLKIGDLVLTKDNGPQPIRWVGSRVPAEVELAFFPEFRPVVIEENALGDGVPNARTALSPLHRVVIDSMRANLLFGMGEVLASAKNLINGTTIHRDPSLRPVYRHILLDEHEILFVNGLEAESLYPGTDRVAPEVLLEREFTETEHDVAPAFVRPELRSYEASLLSD